MKNEKDNGGYVFMNTIYEKIKARRIELGLTQDELAKQMGYSSRSTINKIESGLVDITRNKIEKFATVLNVPPTYLMGWREDIYFADQLTALTGHSIQSNSIQDTFANRLKIAMQRKHLSQTDLSNLTGIGKSSLSTYLKGDYKPQQSKIDLLSSVLGVTSAWLMGYDFPIDYNVNNATFIENLTLKQKEVLENIQNFNDEQLDKLLEYILFLKTR